MPGSGLYESHKISGRTGKVQDVRPLQEGVPDGSRHLGEKDTSRHKFREVHSLSVLHPGL